jgi:hypothetical protein
LSSTTAKIATANCRLPASRGSLNRYAISVITAATSSITANRSVNCAANRRATDGPGGRRSSLRPSRASLAAASAEDKPRRVLPDTGKGPRQVQCLHRPASDRSGRDLNRHRNSSPTRRSGLIPER